MSNISTSVMCWVDENVGGGNIRMTRWRQSVETGKCQGKELRFIP